MTNFIHEGTATETCKKGHGFALRRCPPSLRAVARPSPNGIEELKAVTASMTLAVETLLVTNNKLNYFFKGVTK
jgi:hypothetical protein